jgi:hypothetical protein
MPVEVVLVPALSLVVAADPRPMIVTVTSDGGAHEALCETSTENVMVVRVVPLDGLALPAASPSLQLPAASAAEGPSGVGAARASPTRARHSAISIERRTVAASMVRLALIPAAHDRT